MFFQSVRNIIFGVAILLPMTCSAFCFQEAAEEYNLSPQLLSSIAKHESKMNPSAVNWNTNGTYDFGLMQINVIHAGDLKKAGIPWNALADPCTNVRVGAWILAKCFAKYGNTWEGVGCYNSQTPSKRDKYARSIYQVIRSSKPQIQTAKLKPPSITEIASIKPGSHNTWETVIGLDTFQ